MTIAKRARAGKINHTNNWNVFRSILPDLHVNIGFHSDQQVGHVVVRLSWWLVRTEDVAATWGAMSAQ